MYADAFIHEAPAPDLFINALKKDCNESQKHDRDA